jgi:hypothetical protein
MVTEKVSVTLGGEIKKRKKNRGWGEGKYIVAIERFSFTTWVWQLKTFQLPHVGGHQNVLNCHGGIVIEMF